MPDAVSEEVCVGEEERGIPAKQDQARNLAGLRMAREVVIALQAGGTAPNPGPVNWAGIVLPSGSVKITLVGLAGGDAEGSETQTGTFLRSCAPAVIVTS